MASLSTGQGQRHGDGSGQPDAGANRTPAANTEEKDVTANIGALVDTALARVAGKGSERQVVDDSAMQSLRQPLIDRMAAGQLAEMSLSGFVSAIAHGGLPLELFRNDPLVSIEDGLQRIPLQPGWLPKYLTERVVKPAQDFDARQESIIGLMQSTMKSLGFNLPVFFFGSAAVPSQNVLSDIDIATSCWLRGQHMSEYDKYFGLLVREMNADSRIWGRKNHVGAVTEHMVQALAVSALRYGRALRVTQDEVFAIERA